MDTVVKASDEVVEDVAEEVADLTVTATTDPHGGNIDVIYSTDQVEKALEVKDIPSSPTRMPSVVDTIPDDIKDLTIRNLDTNEEYVIGENDPDFEFDTFELRSGGDSDSNSSGNGIASIPVVAATVTLVGGSSTNQSSESYFSSLFSWFSGGDSTISSSTSSSPTRPIKPKTPYSKLSSFIFKRELGRGAFGKVMLVESRVDGAKYALKILSKKHLRSSDKKQLRAERDILHSMSQKSPHPFTTGLKFAFQSENNLYLGMDYFPGGNMKELIKSKGRLPEDWARLYAAELILALSHLHFLNVLYRDIKPHNIMLDGRGHIVLIDFGLSKQDVYCPQEATSLVGTPDYSAPEVLKTGVYRIEASDKKRAPSRAGHRKSSLDISPDEIGYGKSADWWSLGVMLYEMLAGCPPFRGSNLRDTYKNVLFAEIVFTPVELFSPAAQTLIAGLLNRDPAQRLGATMNPPSDIMWSEFFSGIDWQAIYGKVCPGPAYMHNVLTNNYGSSSRIRSISGSGAADLSGKSSMNERPTLGNAADMNMRESIITSSQQMKNKSNCIEDWSFLDDSILRGITSDAPLPNSSSGSK